MTKRLWLTTPAVAIAALLTLTGCAGGTTPSGEAPSPIVTLTQQPDLGDQPTFEEILPENSTSAAVALRSEGRLTPGEPVDATAKDAADGGWVAEFACAAEGSVTAEVLIDDQIVVASTPVECEAATPTALKFTGGGTITLRITGESDGIYVSQLSKDASV